jgi:hypothetical protein
MTRSSATQDVPESVRLVVADVDGTLVTPDKILTPKARAAVPHVIDAGIAFTITSGRPPLGMKMLIDDLQLANADETGRTTNAPRDEVPPLD